MARNRKNQSGVLRFGPALKAFALCALFGGASLGYVWQRSQIDQLGRQMEAAEIKRAELRAQNAKLRDRLAELQSPEQLQKKLVDLKLGLVPPSPRDVWRVPEPVIRPAGEPAGPSVRQLAAR